MGDTTASPHHVCLFETAAEQHGYFLAAQARAWGFGWDLLSYHTRTGRFVRVRRGLYRLRDYPSSTREDVVAAWLAVGKDKAVVSHESALDLLDLSDVVPNAIHLTVPRSVRHLPRLPGVKIHTTKRQFQSTDVTDWEGIPVTAAARTILDAAETGTAPEQIELAVCQAVRSRMTTRTRLEEGARQRGRRTRELVTGALVRCPATG
jgi:predicted transcriptional regulator of viral defense system